MFDFYQKAIFYYLRSLPLYYKLKLRFGIIIINKILKVVDKTIIIINKSQSAIIQNIQHLMLGYLFLRNGFIRTIWQSKMNGSYEIHFL